MAWTCGPSTVESDMILFVVSCPVELSRIFVDIVPNLFYLNCHVRTYVALDRMAHLDQLAEKIDSVFERGSDVSFIHRQFKTLKRRAKPSAAKTVRLVDPVSGFQSQTPLQEKLVVRNHFSAQLGGTEVSLADLHQLSLDVLSGKLRPTALLGLRRLSLGFVRWRPGSARPVSGPGASIE